MFRKGQYHSAAGKEQQTERKKGGGSKFSHQTQRRKGVVLAMAGWLINVHIILFFLILELGWGTWRSTSLPTATAPGDIIIGGIFPIHEDVDKEIKSFEPHIRPCIRWAHSSNSYSTLTAKMRWNDDFVRWLSESLCMNVNKSHNNNSQKTQKYIKVQHLVSSRVGLINVSHICIWYGMYEHTHATVCERENNRQFC